MHSPLNNDGDAAVIGVRMRRDYHRKATFIEPRSILRKLGQEQDRKYKQVSICFAKDKKAARCKKHVVWVMTFSYVYLVLSHPLIQWRPTRIWLVRKL